MTTIVICTIYLTVKSSIGPIDQKADVEGRLLSENKTKYLVDFSEGVKRFNHVLKSNGIGDYSKVLVDKDDCLKEN